MHDFAVPSGIWQTAIIAGILVIFTSNFNKKVKTAACRILMAKSGLCKNGSYQMIYRMGYRMIYRMIYRTDYCMIYRMNY